MPRAAWRVCVVFCAVERIRSGPRRRPTSSWVLTRQHGSVLALALRLNVVPCMSLSRAHDHSIFFAGGPFRSSDAETEVGTGPGLSGLCVRRRAS